MKLDLQKIDEHIKKLQELRRLAADPEMTRLLVEFMAPGDEPSGTPQAPKSDGNGAPVTSDETNELLKEVMSGTEPQPQTGGGLWRRRS